MYPYDLPQAVIDELKTFFVERRVDNMTTEDLVEYVYDSMIYDVDRQPDKEFLRDAMDYWDDHFDDVVEEMREIAFQENHNKDV